MKREVIILALSIVVFSVQFPLGRGAFDIDQTALPDLIVTDFWQEGDYIYYQVMNVGDDLASGVHVDALFINTDQTAENVIDRSLTPEERYKGMFSFNAGALVDEAISVKVWTDVNNSIIESNETNNWLEKMWGADSTPPEFLSEPEFDNLTDTSAVISWVTDEYSDSRVEYGKTSGIYDLVATDSEFVTLHTVTLPELDAYTTYHYMVKSADSAGNMVQSGEHMFQTMALPDNIFPTLSMENISSPLQGKVSIIPAVSDDTGIEKVEYSIDNVVVFTAYSSPYTLPLDTWSYLNGQHMLEARAFDQVGNSESDQWIFDVANYQDKTVPIVKIQSPNDGDIVSGIVEVQVDFKDDLGLSSASFYINGTYQECKDLHGFDEHSDYFAFPASWFQEGARLTLAVVARDLSCPPNEGNDNVRVVVHNPNQPPQMPELRPILHKVERSNNVFTVTIQIKNIGYGDAVYVQITDGLKGFQPIEASTSDAYYFDITSAPPDNPDARWSMMDILSKVSIPAQASRTYTYKAMPVLLHPSPPTPTIGFFLNLYYESTSGDKKKFVWPADAYMTESGEVIAEAHEEAVKTCDYLIVTDPERLFSKFSPDYLQGSILSFSESSGEVNTLLSTMAELAFYKAGALGYFDASSVETLKNLIKPGGDWAKKMSPKFSTVYGGWLLLVGEDDIVPAVHIPGWKGPDSFPDNVWDSDQCYSDTTGLHGCPELNVGRIIGNAPSNLINVIRTSIGVYGGASGYGYDFSHAVLVSGKDPFTQQTTDVIVNHVNTVKSILSQKGLSTWVIHEKDWDWFEAEAQFASHVQNVDVIYMCAHGSEDSCAFVGTGWLKLGGINFMGSNPIVFASSCDAGDYASGNGYNLAEAFLDKGAGVYIGSTADSLGSPTTLAGFMFNEHYSWGPSVLGPPDFGRPGPVLTYIERMFSTMDSSYRFWAAEYNLYGDPKFGDVWWWPKTSSLSILPTQSCLQEMPLSSIDVDVPDYVNTTIGSLDYVDIPGGALLLDVGHPQVPICCTTVDYPKGVEVQNVILNQRSGLTTGTGLNLPIANMEFISASIANSVASEAEDGWYPEKNYEWKVLENPDGTTTLYIWTYPFYYNALTTDFRFYKNYQFDINYTVSQVELTDLATDRDVYRQGDPLRIDMMLTNTGTPQNVIVNSVLKRCGGGQDELVYGFPLRTLKDFKTAAASFSEECDTTGLDPGYYYAEVTLRNMNGELLDKKTQVFKLGVSSVEITDFTATPGYFGFGDDVQTKMTLRNDGTVYINGTAVTRILNSTGQVMQEFRSAIVNLAPSADFTVTNMWNTSGVAEGSYNVIGWVEYNDGLSDIHKATVKTDYVSPSLVIETPRPNAAVQDGVDFTILATDVSGVASVAVSIRSAEGDVLSSQFELMPAALEQDGKWHLYFDTRQLPDCFYSFIANGTDVLGNWGTETVRFSIRNWAAIELLPSSESNKAGRTMPVKLSLRVDASVDSEQPFIWNEELTIRIYQKGHPEDVLQTSVYGTGARNYRIDPVAEIYITNFKTSTTPKTYVVEIYRKDMLIGAFEFKTVK